MAISKSASVLNSEGANADSIVLQRDPTRTNGSDGATPASIFCGETSLFRSGFDSFIYTFKHNLAGDPLFEPEKLLALAREMSQNPEDVYFDAGDVSIGQRWADVAPTQLSATQLLADIEKAQAWIVLRRPEKFSEYANLLDRSIAEIGILSERNIDRLMELKNSIIFINSPYRISSYHIDRECNWLLQIRGTKTIHVFDKNDRQVIPEEEIERFWAVDNNAARYKPQFEDRATVTTLRPGDGIHIPVGSPHWVQNGNQVSMSLSINFHYRETITADIYRLNYVLRKIGLRPNPPGQSPIGDWAKRAVSRPVFYLRKNLHRFRRRKEKRYGQ